MPCFRHFIIQKIINYYFSFVSFRIKKPFLIPVPPGYFYVLLVLLESFYISKLPLPPGYHCVERGCIAESKDYITHGSGSPYTYYLYFQGTNTVRGERLYSWEQGLHHTWVFSGSPHTYYLYFQGTTMWREAV